MASSSFSRLIVVPSIALISLGVLSGCGAVDMESSGHVTSGQATASATSSDESISTSVGESSTPAAEPSSTEAAGSPSAGATTSASAGASVSSSAGASSEPSSSSKGKDNIPEGYIKVEARGSGISFAVPEKWVAIDGAGLADEAKLQEFLKSISKDARPAKKSMQSQADKTDVFVWDTASNADGYTENIHVNSRPVKPEDALPSENDMKAMLRQDWLSPKEYKVIGTPLGQGVSQTYSAVAGGKTVYGAFLYVPTPVEDGFYSAIMVSTTSADRCNELVSALLDSLAPLN